MIGKIDKQKEARFLHDLKDRNDNTYPNKTPIPDIPSIINCIARHPYRSKIDITNAYHEVRILPEHEKYAAFATPFGTFRTRVMQQGDCNAPATMMKLMHSIFQDMLGIKVFIYLDDILIFSKTLEDHIETIREICRRLRKHKLYANRSKSAFLPDRISVLGHVLTTNGIIAAPEKLLKVQNWAIPQTRKQLQGFMGMVNYLSQYVPHLSTYAAPLTQLCGSKALWKWRHIHTKAFEQLKDILAAEAILKPLDYESKEPIYLVTDASASGIGAWIGQGPTLRDIRPAGFYSRKFNAAQSRYNTTDKELFAIITGLQHFQPQLLGTKFTILTDHKAALAFRENNDVNDQHVRWQMLMSIFEFDMQHLDGKRNVLADALSRIYINPEKLPPFTSISSASITMNKASTLPSPASPTPSTLSSTSHTSTSTPTSSTSTKTTKMQQFTSTTIDRSHTKCDFNLCSSRGVSAGHHEDCPFDEDDLQYQLERDLPAVSSAAQALQQPSTNYQPLMVESDHDSDSDVWEQDLENNIWYKVYSQAERIEDDDENDADDSEDDDFCETLGSASMLLDDMTTTHDETSSEQSCSACSDCDLTSPQQPPPAPPTPPAPTQTISASAATINAATVKKHQNHEHGRR